MMRNASERKDIRRAEKEARQHELARTEFIQAAMGTRQGRAWFHDFLVSCHIFSDPFTGDALIEAYSKGERNIGLRVYNDIMSSCPNQFVSMMQEANIKEHVNERRTATDEHDGSEDGDRGDQGSEPDDRADNIYADV